MTTTKSEVIEAACPRCEKTFSCGAKAGNCWCQSLATLGRVSPEPTNCYCRVCLEALLDTQATRKDAIAIDTQST
ncbi:MAG: cysteine-rich CWC family protein [Burkholderiales bacterium]